MNYTDTVEQATEYLRMTLALISKNKITPNPVNFEVWYIYAGGKNSRLTNAINQLLKSKGSVTEEDCLELHKTHICFHNTLSEQIHDSVNKVMESLSDQILDSNDRVQHYGNILGSVDEHLNPNDSKSTLTNVLKTLSEETKVMQECNSELTTRLSQSSQELEQLKAELEEARSAANTDVLTGIPNRQSFEVTMEQLTSVQSPFSLLFADIDFFKNFNDTYGHQLGDKVLRFVAQTLKEHLKGQDMVARYGGEEFVIILPNTPLKGAYSVAENIRKAVQSQRLRRTDNQEYIGNITLSIGASVYRPGEKSKETIERADSALYLSKSNGRNCVSLETELKDLELV